MQTIPANGHVEGEDGLDKLPIFADEGDGSENRTMNFRLKPIEETVTMVGEDGRLMLAGFHSSNEMAGGDSDNNGKEDEAADIRRRLAAGGLSAEEIARLNARLAAIDDGDDEAASLSRVAELDALRVMPAGLGAGSISIDSNGSGQNVDSKSERGADGTDGDILSNEAFEFEAASAKLDDEEADIRRRLAAGGLSAEEIARLNARLTAIDNDRTKNLRNRAIAGKSGPKIVTAVYALADKMFLRGENLPLELVEGLKRTKDWGRSSCQELMIELEKYWLQQGKDGKWFRERLEHFRSGKVDSSDLSRFLGGAVNEDEAAKKNRKGFVCGKRGESGDKKHHMPKHAAAFLARTGAEEGTNEKKKKGKRDKLSWGAAGPHEAVVLNDEDGSRRQSVTSGSATTACVDDQQLPFVINGDTAGGSMNDALRAWGELPVMDEGDMLRLQRELYATQWARHNSVDYIDQDEVLEGKSYGHGGMHTYGERPGTAPNMKIAEQLADTITTSGIMSSKAAAPASDDVHSIAPVRKVRSDQWHIGRKSEAGFRYIAPASRSHVSRRTTRPHTDWGGGFSSSDATRSLRKEKGRAKHLRELRAADKWLHGGTAENVVLSRRLRGARDTSTDLDSIMSGGGVSRPDPSTSASVPLSVTILSSSVGSSSDSETSERSTQSLPSQANYRTARRARKKFGPTHLDEMEPLAPGGGSAFDAALESGGLSRRGLVTSAPQFTASSRAFLDPPLTQFRSSHTSPVKKIYTEE